MASTGTATASRARGESINGDGPRRGREMRVRHLGSEESFERFSRIVDLPLIVLAVLMIPVLVVPSVMDLSDAAERTLAALDYLIWAVFAVEYVIKLFLTTARWRFVKSHVPDLIIILVPMLRPLRILRSARLLRLMRLTRVIAFAVNGLMQARTVLNKRGLNYVLLVALAVLAVGAFLVREFERGVDGGNIESFPDAIWWSIVTVTTVGYGDHFPVTAGGRGVAIVLMITGIAVFGVLTASIAAYFVEQDEEQSQDQELSEKLDAVLARLQAIESQIASSSERADAAASPAGNRGFAGSRPFSRPGGDTSEVE